MSSSTRPGSSPSSRSRKMDLASKAMDLTRALLDLTGSTTVTATGQLMRWLERGGIDENEFTYCTGLISRKAFPNESGLRLRKAVLNTSASKGKLGGLRVVLPMCIGRLMVSDYDYCYVVTTVAAAMAYHEIPFAVEILCNLAVDVDPKDDAALRHGTQYPYDIRRTRVRPVIEKIVQSIADNIINRGIGLPDLPEELLDLSLCRHVVEADIFSAMITSVQRASVMKVVLVAMDVFYTDVVLWLLNHFSGSIEVSVPGEKLVNVRALSGSSKVTILVRNRCDPGDPTHEHGLSPFIEVSTGDGTTKKVLFHADGEAQEIRSRYSPTTRRCLYDVSLLEKHTEPDVRSQGVLDNQEMASIKVTAKKIAEWMLDLPLEPIIQWNDSPGKSCLKYRGFRTTFKQESGKFSVKMILSRWPDLPRMTTSAEPKHVVFVPRETPENIDLTDYSENLSASFSQRDFDGVPETLRRFPPAITLLDNVRRRCMQSGCPDCRQKAEYGTCRPGCLTEMALTGLFTLIGHVIAEGFGADDVSGLGRPTVLKWGVAKLLYQLTAAELILWDTWFAVASVVYLGCPWDELKFVRGKAARGSGASCISAVQYGSMVMVAGWTDMDIERLVPRCFGARFAPGYQLDGVKSDFGVVLAEETGVFGEVDEPAMNYAFDTDDDDQVSLDTFIIGSGGSQYRLLTLVRSNDYLRQVDPSAGLWNLSNGGTLSCSHGRDTHPKDIAGLHSYSFSELLKCWIPSWPQDGSVNNTIRMDSHMKVNVALCLTPGVAFIRPPNCCIPCAVSAAKSCGMPGIQSRWRPIISKVDLTGTLTRR
ncbi:hypothetical protein GGR56DRAFT_628392 [Xylariaceae sp. FL0804]|nr:hypothetical protein GGR56DRAFT_628392 [Xylariaceae sp. FL0804]